MKCFEYVPRCGTQLCCSWKRPHIVRGSASSLTHTSDLSSTSARLLGYASYVRARTGLLGLTVVRESFTDLNESLATQMMTHACNARKVYLHVPLSFFDTIFQKIFTMKQIPGRCTILCSSVHAREPGYLSATGDGE
jgi:hypothetical protein